MKTINPIAPRYSEIRRKADFWSVFIPNDVDRSIFIQNCYRTNTVSVVNTYGDVVHNAKVSKSALRDIEFPSNNEILGSEVLAIPIPRAGTVVVTEVFNKNDESDFLSEKEFKTIRFSQNNSTSLSLSPEEGSIELTNTSEEKNEIVIKTSGNDDSTTKIESQGSILTTSKAFKKNIEQSYQVIIEDATEDGKRLNKTYNRESLNISLSEDEKILSSFELKDQDFKYEDQRNKINLNDGSLNINPKEGVILGEGSEPLLLGQKTIDLLSEILQTLTATLAGPYNLSTAGNFSAIKQKLNSLLSQYSKTK